MVLGLTSSIRVDDGGWQAFIFNFFLGGNGIDARDGVAKFKRRQNVRGDSKFKL